MLTPKDFQTNELSSQQSFALWFHDMVHDAIKAIDTDNNAKYHIDREERAILIRKQDLPYRIVKYFTNNKAEIKTILKEFGWTLIDDKYADIDYYDDPLFKFHWTDEKINPNNNLIHKYKYVTLNNVMWDYGHTDMKKFDVWFEQVAKKHQRHLSHYEMLNSCLAIQYKKIQQANEAFVKNEVCQVSVDSTIETITLKKTYVDHLKSFGWHIHDELIDNENWLICNWNSDR